DVGSRADRPGTEGDPKMPYTLYVGLQDEDKIVAFAIDAATGQLAPQAATAVTGGPSGMAITPDRRTLYVGHRTQPAISSFRIDQGTGGLSLFWASWRQHPPALLSPPPTRQHLPCAPHP